MTPADALPRLETAPSARSAALGRADRSGRGTGGRAPLTAHADTGRDVWTGKP
jgi:hypothetical protein